MRFTKSERKMMERIVQSVEFEADTDTIRGSSGSALSSVRLTVAQMRLLARKLDEMLAETDGSEA